ncbi:hypothetical protein C1645_820063 [Glomus cerebriforme]|uniref:F-box domain-containing protein n=1 Tax=Glomus cerebriforme TaxID=658196 RepID=A0A397T4W3_9GLOM|nr:hypothetical protein C1645_820063 [Glomus cerebriforme]
MMNLNVDCLSLIFNELQTDKNHLHSCLLVNRKWCHLVVPILWKKHPWYEENKKLFNTLFSCLPKQLLIDNDIRLPSTILSKPSFNYISFCKYLKTENISEIIRTIFAEQSSVGKYNKRNLLEQEICKLFIRQCKNIRELSWQTSQPLSLFQGASTCFSQLHSLSINIDLINSDALYKMAQICKNLNILTIRYFSYDNPGLISIINAQKNLKSISLYCSVKRGSVCKELNKVLAKKGNTISIFTLRSVNIIPPSFLTSLINLKILTIFNDYDNEEDDNEDTRDKIKEFQQYLAISEFPELQILRVNGLSCFKELSMLVEKTKGNILRINIYTYNQYSENTEMLIKAIASNCPNIEQLSTYIEPKDFIYVQSLLLNCRNLMYLGLNSLNSLDFLDENDYIGDELLDILTKFSPKSLTDVIISKDWKYSVDAFGRFFKSCTKNNLFNFGINNNDYITEVIRESKLYT